MNPNLRITVQMIRRLNDLTEKIRKNQANLNDYNEYEELLIQSGAFTQNQIHKYLRNVNVVDYYSLIHARNQAKRIEDKQFIESGAIVGLVALGFALIFNGVTH